MIKNLISGSAKSLICFSLLATAGSSFVFAKRLAEEPVKNSGLNVHHEVMDNGMTLLLLPRKQTTTVACRLFYTTGSVHEHAGNSGIAHMLEHMLFKGTRKVGTKDSVEDARLLAQIDSLRALIPANPDKKVQLLAQADSVLQLQRALMIDNELWRTYQEAGGTGLNAFTTDPMTAYFVTLPKNKVELFFWLESDRMQNAVLREFYPERDVVREERRLRYDDRPTGRYNETLNALFWEAHPYRTPTIGWPSDIENYSRSQAEEHYRKYYKPNNAILVLVGDFDLKSTRQQILKYFGSIPRGEDFAPVTIREPEQVGAKSFEVYRDDAKPRVDIMFHTVPIRHEDIYALDVMEGVLNGRSGRMHKSLVEEQKLATAVGAGNYIRKYEGSFEFSALIHPESNSEALIKGIWQEIKKLQNAPISEVELQKVKNNIQARRWRSLENMEHLATELAFYEMYGSWDIIETFPAKVAEVTAEQVQKVAQKYFKHYLSTTGKLLPAELSPDYQAPLTKEVKDVQ